MSEHGHASVNPPEVALYHEHIRQFTFATPDLTEPGLDFSLRAAILAACDRLQAATEEYATASGLLAGALGRDADARLNLEYIEADARARLYRDGVPGTNEAARQAILATMLADDPDVDDARQARDTAHGDRLTAEHHFRVCDQAQKSLRARLDALSALVRAS
jgi:hypothetical protein